MMLLGKKSDIFFPEAVRVIQKEKKEKMIPSSYEMKIMVAYFWVYWKLLGKHMFGS
jgi:hypothetical protein